jgi:hypothetical protein
LVGDYSQIEAQVSQASAAASLYLNAKVSAHGGLLHHHAHRISVLLAEERSETRR